MPNDAGFWNHNNVLIGMDYACGLLMGNFELGFVVPSCKENMRFVISTDSSLMDKDQLNDLKHVIETELEILFDDSADLSDHV